MKNSIHFLKTTYNYNIKDEEEKGGNKYKN